MRSGMKPLSSKHSHISYFAESAPQKCYLSQTDTNYWDFKIGLTCFMEASNALSESICRASQFVIEYLLTLIKYTAC